MISEELYKLKTFFEKNPVVALCFSGGVDSAYVLYAALHYGAKVKAYYVKSAFQPQFELNDALSLAKQLKADVSVLETNILSVRKVKENPEDRCYHCKTAIMTLIKKQAAKDGFSALLDGTNASDEACERPGMRALTELSIHSPLRECGITKFKVRLLSKKAGLPTWNKPAYACLATRVPTGTVITAEALKRIERAEKALFNIGFTDFRVRMLGRTAKLQIPVSQMETALELRETIIESLKPDFDSILLDLAGH